MAKRQKQKITDPYTLRMRTFDRMGKPKDWVNSGTGQFLGIDLVQRQIRTLKSNMLNRTVEFEFSYKGELRDFNGNVTGKSMIFKARG